MVEHFPKIQPLKEILEFQNWKRAYETYKKRKSQTRNLINYQKFKRWTLYQFENKEAKSAKLRAKIKWELEGEKSSKTFFKVGVCKIKQYVNYIFMIINQNFLATLLTFSNLQNISTKNFIPKRQLPKLSLINFSAKFLIGRKYIM